MGTRKHEFAVRRIFFISVLALLIVKGLIIYWDPLSNFLTKGSFKTTDYSTLEFEKKKRDLDSLKFAVNQAKAECDAGKMQMCTGLGELLDKIGKIKESRRILLDTCMKDPDELDACFKYGMRNNDKEFVQTDKNCRTGKLKECIIAAGRKYKLNDEPAAQDYLRYACYHGLWNSCSVLGERLKEKDIPSVASKCMGGDLYACPTAASAAYAKTRKVENAIPYLKFACKGGDLTSCMKLGEFASAVELEKMLSECVSKNATSCVQIAGRVKTEPALRKSFFTVACNDGLNSACDLAHNISLNSGRPSVEE